jgi:hypothetical protein
MSQPQVILYGPGNVDLVPMLPDANTFTGINTFTQNIVGNVTGTVTGSSSLNVLKAGDTMTGNLKLGTAGNGLYVKEGTNSTMGVVTLVLGVATVSTTKVTANSRIFLTTQGGTLTNVASVYISARTPGTSFTITSMNLLDTSDVGWLIVEPA